jgi:hypothetical protein
MEGERQGSSPPSTLSAAPVMLRGLKSRDHLRVTKAALLERKRDLSVKIFTPATTVGAKMRIYSAQISWYLFV